jgi:molybdopterin converting factor small subunit
MPAPAPGVSVTLPGALASLFPGCPRAVPLEASTVGEAVTALDQLWPGFRDRVCDGSPALRRHIRIFVRGEIAGLQTQLVPGDEVVVITAISGG